MILLAAGVCLIVGLAVAAYLIAREKRARTYADQTTLNQRWLDDLLRANETGKWDQL